MKINYPLAISSWDQKEVVAILDTIVSDQYSMGSRVKKCEADFAKFIGSKYCVMVNSGSSANLLAVAALRYRKMGMGLKPGDEVIVPAVSWSTTYYPLYQYGLKLRYVDIDLDTLNIDLDQLKNAITPETKAIFLVHLLGNPANMTEILSLCEDNDLILLEDTCESLGARVNDKYCGTFGLMGTFSSFFSHHISTMEGGFVVTDDEEIYHILLSLRAHGWTRNLPTKNLVSNKSNIDFEESFRFVLPGYNLRPLEMSGAIGSIQLKKLPSFVKQRRENAEYFQKCISEIQEIKIQKEIGMSSWFGFSMLCSRRDELIEIFNDANVTYRPIVAGNFAKNPVNKYFNYEIVGDLKNAKLVDSQGLFIGNHHIDCRVKIGQMIDIIKVNF